MRAYKKMTLIVVIAVVALLATTAAIQARAMITEFSGTEACIPKSPGEWTFPDGNIQIRGMVLECIEDTTEPRMQGPNTVILNANWHADPEAMMGGTGPMWGTWQMENWAGTWEGSMMADGGVYHAQGKGTGIYTLLKVWLDSDHGVITGRMLDPQGGE